MFTRVCREEPVKYHYFYLHWRDDQGYEPLFMGHSEEMHSLQNITAGHIGTESKEWGCLQ